MVSRRTTLATTGDSTAVAAAAGTAPAAALVVDSSLALAKAPAQRPASTPLATDTAGLLAEQISASGGDLVVAFLLIGMKVGAQFIRICQES